MKNILITRVGMVGISKCYHLFSFLCISALTVFVVHAQLPQSGFTSIDRGIPDNSSYTDATTGFISIDCGIDDNSSYTDSTSGINYTSDRGFVDSGVAKTVFSQYRESSYYDRQFWTVRSFPEGDRNCYTLRPSGGSRGNKYLIRARFLYGNYDGLNQPPEFDLYIGVDYWDTVTLDDASIPQRHEIIHVPPRDYISVCLVNISHGTPFISTLELRPLDMSIYETESGSSLNLYGRWDFGSTIDGAFRDKNDIYDRIWIPVVLPDYTTLMTRSSNDAIVPNIFAPPQIVMRTALVPEASDNVYLSWKIYNMTDQFFFYLHFAELQLLQPNQSRQFNIYFNGELWIKEPVVPAYLSTNTIYTTTEAKNYPKYEVTLNKTSNSTLPPILNAFELYTVKNLSGVQTDDSDVDAILSIKSIYRLSKNWQGDPCGPKDYVWAGVTCSSDGSNPPRIISLNLSSSQLGVITPSISNLAMLQSLDLSNNNFTGPVPDFLSQMDSLKVLNLKGNSFSFVPKQLLERSNSGSLSLSIDSFAGQTFPRKKKENKVLVLVLASVVGVVVLMIAALFTLWFIKRRKPQETKRVDLEMSNKDNLIEGKNRKFTYSEVLRITNNFQRVIGKGGFGTVYHAFLGESQVAVKMLSPSSIQGYKEFQAEANLLMSFHHKNIMSLVGYSNEGPNMGIIYEYMANGDLQQHLSDKNPNALSWEDRLRIATDAAQGLEYLHHSCKPPIIHRDVKCTNILLNENFQAKLADIGLSRAFPTESGTRVVVGTPGYLDPDYYTTNRLSEKSDVYSFGVVILKIITGRPAMTKGNYGSGHIVQWVNSKHTIGDITNIVDPRLKGNYDVNSAWKAVEIAMACVSRIPNRRPTMNFVVLELKECLAMEIARGESESDNNVGFTNMDLDNEVSPLAR